MKKAVGMGLVLAWLAASSGAAVPAGTVTFGLTDGRGTLRGRIVAVKAGSVQVITEDDAKRTLAKSDVTMVLDDNGKEVDLGWATAPAPAEAAGSDAAESNAPAADPAAAAKKVAAGNRLFMAEDFNGAIGAFQGALAADPKCVAALKGLASCYEEKGDLDRSLQFTKAAEAAGKPEPTPAPAATAAPSPTPVPTVQAAPIKDDAEQAEDTDDQIAASGRKLRQLRQRRAALQAEQRKAARANDSFGFELLGGYTWVSLPNLQSSLPNNGQMSIHNAYFGGLDLNFDFAHGHLAVGPRARFISGTGTYNLTYYTYNMSGYLTNSQTWTETDSYQLVPVMLGIKYRTQTWAQVELGLNGGYALAYLTHSLTAPGASTYSASYQGGAPTAEATLGLRLGRRAAHLGLEAGYRYLVVSQMTGSNGSLGLSNLDCSGPSIGLQFSVDF